MRLRRRSGSTAISEHTQTTINPPTSVTYTGSGELTLGTTEGPATDPWQPSSTYSCGWTKSPPASISATYQPQIGDKLPDGVFQDQCGDNVRLHDLLGRYLVIQAQQTNFTSCGPCSQGATGQEAFETAMETAKISTLVVSMLVPEYFHSDLTAVLASMKSWVAQYGTAGVALADRGYAPAIFRSVANSPDFGYPAYMLVAPDGTILEATVGIDVGPPSTWDKFQTAIEAHAGN